MELCLVLDANRLEVPFYFFAGRYDYNTPSELAMRYMDVLSAPYKEHVECPESAHMLNVSAAELSIRRG